MGLRAYLKDSITVQVAAARGGSLVVARRAPVDATCLPRLIPRLPIAMLTLERDCRDAVSPSDRLQVHGGLMRALCVGKESALQLGELLRTMPSRTPSVARRAAPVICRILADVRFSQGLAGGTAGSSA